MSYFLPCLSLHFFHLDLQEYDRENDIPPCSSSPASNTMTQNNQCMLRIQEISIITVLKDTFYKNFTSLPICLLFLVVKSNLRYNIAIFQFLQSDDYFIFFSYLLSGQFGSVLGRYFKGSLSTGLVWCPSF